MCMFSISNEKGKEAKRNTLKWRKKWMVAELLQGCKTYTYLRMYLPARIFAHTYSRSIYTRERYPRATSVYVCTNINILVVYCIRPSRIDFRNIGWIKRYGESSGECRENSKIRKTTTTPSSSYHICWAMGDFNVRFFSLACCFHSIFFSCVCWLQCAPPKKHTHNVNNRQAFIERLWQRRRRRWSNENHNERGKARQDKHTKFNEPLDLVHHSFIKIHSFHLFVYGFFLSVSVRLVRLHFIRPFLVLCLSFCP